MKSLLSITFGSSSKLPLIIEWCFLVRLLTSHGHVSAQESGLKLRNRRSALPVRQSTPPWGYGHTWGLGFATTLWHKTPMFHASRHPKDPRPGFKNNTNIETHGNKHKDCQVSLPAVEVSLVCRTPQLSKLQKIGGCQGQVHKKTVHQPRNTRFDHIKSSLICLTFMDFKFPSCYYNM